VKVWLVVCVFMLEVCNIISEGNRKVYVQAMIPGIPAGIPETPANRSMQSLPFPLLDLTTPYNVLCGLGEPS